MALSGGVVADGYTVYWAQSTLAQARHLGLMDAPLTLVFGGTHYSHPDPVKVGMGPGDILYPINVQRGRLHVLAAMRVQTVHAIASDKDAEQLAGRLRLPVLGGCIVSAAVGVGSNLTAGVQVPDDVAAALAFDYKTKGASPVKGVGEDGVWRHVNALHGAWRLAPESAAVFATLFPVPISLA